MVYNFTESFGAGKLYICGVYYVHHMSFVRAIKKPCGTYYALVENYREGKKVRQRVLKYLGKSPNLREISVDPSQAGPIAQAIMSGTASTDEVKEILKAIGLPVIGRLKQVSWCTTPPLGKLTLRIE